MQNALSNPRAHREFLRAVIEAKRKSGFESKSSFIKTTIKASRHGRDWGVKLLLRISFIYLGKSTRMYFGDLLAYLAFKHKHKTAAAKKSQANLRQHEAVSTGAAVSHGKMLSSGQQCATMLHATVSHRCCTVASVFSGKLNSIIRKPLETLLQLRLEGKKQKCT